jgi:uncharacterized membrane protein YhhN
VSATGPGTIEIAHYTLRGLTPAAWLFLALAVIAALVDWWATLEPDRRLQVELAAKPAVLAALTATAATLHTPVPAVREWFLPALLFCLVGDVFLMLPRNKSFDFQAGLGAFLVAHVFFLVGLAQGTARVSTTLIALAVLVPVAGGPAAMVLRSIRRGDEPSLVVPVVLYMDALLVMAAAGWSAGLNPTPFGRNAWLCAGVTLFVVSDTLLALDKFVQPIRRGKLAVHVTYHLAVAAMVVSLAGVAS